jgi:hypothetical protein
MQPMIRSSFPSQPRPVNKTLSPSAAMIVVGVGVLLSMFLMFYFLMFSRFQIYASSAVLPLAISGIIAVSSGHIVLTARVIGVLGFVIGVVSCMFWSLSNGIMAIGLALVIQLIVKLTENLNQNAKQLESLQHDMKALTAALVNTQTQETVQPIMAQPMDHQGAIFNFQTQGDTRR